MALVLAGRNSVRRTLPSQVDAFVVPDLVCRHCWGQGWEERFSELRAQGNLIDVVSVGDLSRTVALQRSLGRNLAAADCATLALAEEKSWLVVAGCGHVIQAAKQMRLRSVAVRRHS